MCYNELMTVAESKLTNQGQVSVPANVRKKLGLAPGSVLEWCENDQGDIIVKRAGKFSSKDIHDALFDKTPKPKTVTQMNEGIKKHLRRKHAGD